MTAISNTIFNNQDPKTTAPKTSVRAAFLMYAWTGLIAGTAVAVAFIPFVYAAIGFVMGLGLLIWAVRLPVVTVHREQAHAPAPKDRLVP